MSRVAKTARDISESLDSFFFFFEVISDRDRTAWKNGRMAEVLGQEVEYGRG